MINDPTVVARRDGDQLVLDCPYCKDEHRHGAAGTKLGAGDGHRIAHCSPGAGKGYFLTEVSA